MGEYEDRYPDAYGRDAAPAPGSPPAERPAAPARPARDRFARRGLLGAGAASEAATPPRWRHAPTRTIRTIEPTRASPPPDYRGVGPRGYVRSPTRIYEDVCDRLTAHPLIDASDIEVLVSGIEVVLAGSVDNAIAAGRAAALAREVPGVKTVRNTLTVREGDHASQR